MSEHEKLQSTMTDQERQEFLSVRKEAGLKIDPASAEVTWEYAETLDPYGVYPDLPEEQQQVGREYFVRSPGSDIWIWFGDLPEQTRDALWEKHKHELALPAGLGISGHNLPPIAEIGKEMAHHAKLWATNVQKGEKHRDAIMVQAFTVRGHMEDPQLRLLVKGLLTEAEVPITKRSSEFTQLLRFAFHKAECKPEPSQLSRWSWALQHAWNQEPRPAPEELIDFIKREGGDVACREKARKAEEAKQAEQNKDQPKPQPIPLTACSLPDELDGKFVKVAKTEQGEWQVIPKTVLSLDTTPAPEATAA